jgi:hypothetical protein
MSRRPAQLRVVTRAGQPGLLSPSHPMFPFLCSRSSFVELSSQYEGIFSCYPASAPGQVSVGTRPLYGSGALG